MPKTKKEFFKKKKDNRKFDHEIVLNYPELPFKVIQFNNVSFKKLCECCNYPILDSTSCGDVCPHCSDIWFNELSNSNFPSHRKYYCCHNCGFICVRDIFHKNGENRYDPGIFRIQYIKHFTFDGKKYDNLTPFILYEDCIKELIKTNSFCYEIAK